MWRRAPSREDLAAAMATCADAIPCWIMPTWRISQCLPARLAAFDLVVLDEASKHDVCRIRIWSLNNWDVTVVWHRLVVLDEASQSDITALPALLRGARVLVVGDHKQVHTTQAVQRWCA